MILLAKFRWMGQDKNGNSAVAQTRGSGGLDKAVAMNETRR